MRESPASGRSLGDGGEVGATGERAGGVLGVPAVVGTLLEGGVSARQGRSVKL